MQRARGLGRTDPPFQRRTWKRRRTRALDAFPHLEAAIRVAAAKAKVDGAELASFRALHLNLGVDEVGRQSLLDAGVWESCEVDVLPPAEGPSTWGDRSRAAVRRCPPSPAGGRARAASKCSRPFHASRTSPLVARLTTWAGLYERMYER